MGLFAVGSVSQALPVRGPGLVPAGTSSFSFVFNSSTVTQRFTPTATGDSLGGRFAHELTWDQLGEAIGDEDLKRAIEKGRRGLKKTTSDVAGSVDPKIQSGVNALLPKLVVGLTDKWALHMSLPVSQVDYNIESQFRPGNDFRRTLITAGVSLDEQQAVIDQLSSRTEGEAYGVGDADITNYFSLVSSFNFNVVGIAGVTLPSSRVGSSDATDSTNPSQGQVDFSMGLAAELIHSADLNSQISVVRNIQTPTNVKITVVREGEAGESVVKVSPGDILLANYNLAYQVNPQFSASSFYSYQQKDSQTFSGDPHYKPTFRMLEKNTEMSLHSVGLSLSYTNQGSQISESEQPFALTVTASRPVAGENIKQSEQIGLSLGFFL